LGETGSSHANPPGFKLGRKADWWGQAARNAAAYGQLDGKQLATWFLGYLLLMGPPWIPISGFIPSYTHLQPWLDRVCWENN